MRESLVIEQIHQGHWKQVCLGRTAVPLRFVSMNFKLVQSAFEWLSQSIYISHVEVLLKGRRLMLWFKYIFRILKLEETLQVLYYLWEKIQNMDFVSGWTCFQMPDTFIFTHCGLLFFKSKLETIIYSFQNILKTEIRQKEKVLEIIRVRDI